MSKQFSNIKGSIIVVSLIVLLSTSYTQEQNTQTPKLKRILVVRTSPVFTLQFNLSYNQGVGQLGGTYNADFRSDQFIDGGNFGATKGFGTNVTAKMRLDDMGHFRLLVSAYYNLMRSYLTGNKTNVFDLGKSQFNVYSIGGGIENNFTPNHKVKIYVGLQPLLSLINGSATLWVENHGVGNPYTYGVKINNSIRLGAAINGGLEYYLSEDLGLNVGFNLIHANLFTKLANYTGDLYSINLMDGDSESSVPYAGKKNFVILNLSLGISFYWGIEQKRYPLSN